MTAPNVIVNLVSRFEENIDEFKSNSYDETTLRIEFINKFFNELGWDVNNEKGYSLAYRDVIHEANIRGEKSTKHPDYAFRIGGNPKFYVETKKPSVDLEHDPKPAHQLRSYLWNTKLPIGVLTDFEHLIIYDGRNKPALKDKASVSRLKVYKYTDYIDKWDEISGVFSKEAMLKGSFDKYVADDTKKKGTMKVDDVFLQQMEKWRLNLAKNIALRNKYLTVRELNFAVHRIIDRIIFLRICEDRGIEGYNALFDLTKGSDIYKHLCDMFQIADKRFNSGLFHFTNEKGREGSPDEFTLKLKIDDKVLKEIISEMYYPKSPFQFNLMPADILGQVYEQFLGYVIRLTPSHQAKIEEKPEVRKAGGVYYTPTYIVEYIVKNTVGRLVDGKTPEELNEMSILDPACGSGSFLIEAYQFMLDWHLSYYVDNRPEKWAKGKKPRVFKGNDNEWRLTTQEKKRILINNIYGVDIDQQAVEVTKLSLLLKVLEDESKETLQQSLFKERVLPDLGNNIKCGNSLIGSDFYANRDLTLFDDEEQYRINVFDWEDAYPEVFKRGGFDAIIGNPPYVVVKGGRYTEFEERKDVIDYYIKKYEALQQQINTYVIFIVKSIALIKDFGFLGFIIPNTILTNDYNEKIRKYLLINTTLLILNNVGKVFNSAVVEGLVTVMQKENTSKESSIECTYNNKTECLSQELFIDYTYKSRYLLHLDENAISILRKIVTDSIELKKICFVWRGLTTGNDSKYITKEKKDINHKKLIKGKHVHRYILENTSSYVNYLPDELDRPRKRDIFEQPEKLVSKFVGKRLQFAYDTDMYYVVNTGCVIYLHSNVKLCIKTILGILNSKLMNYYFNNTFTDYRKVFPIIKSGHLEQLPIRTIDFNNSSDVEKHDKMVSLVEQMLKAKEEEKVCKTTQERAVKARLIKAIDMQIDKLVYELYELTDKEIRIVESYFDEK